MVIGNCGILIIYYKIWVLADVSIVVESDIKCVISLVNFILMSDKN